MKYRQSEILKFVLSLLLISVTVPAQEESALDADAIIAKILADDAKQRSEIQTVTFDAEYIEKESNGNGGYDEKLRFEKKIRLKYLPDTIWYKRRIFEIFQKWFRPSR